MNIKKNKTAFKQTRPFSSIEQPFYMGVKRREPFVESPSMTPAVRTHKSEILCLGLRIERQFARLLMLKGGIPFQSEASGAYPV